MSTKEARELGIGSGVARAVSLSQGQKQSKETIKMMYNFFNRHSAFKKHHKDNPPSNSLISWLLWGGDEGRDWVENIIKI